MTVVYPLDTVKCRCVSAFLSSWGALVPDSLAYKQFISNMHTHPPLVRLAAACLSAGDGAAMRLDKSPRNVP